ncbi:MAG: xanthine dehydrogenase family protein molybdopterin-binding subunit, partial [Candidatus Bathyarchaeia archaeon]
QCSGRPVVAAASFNPPNTPIDPETGRGSPFPCYVYATQVADVEVDVETGLVKVLRIVAAHDVGKAINPTLLQVQVEGGIAMGLGQALTEEIKLRDGRTRNPNFREYLIPTAMDTPQVEVCIVEDPEPSGPFGAKAAAEAPNIPTTPAILNAIYDATGVRIRELPATPEKILSALKQSG